MKTMRRVVSLLLCMALVLTVMAPVASAAQMSAQAPAYVTAPTTDAQSVVELTGGEWTLTDHEPVQFGTENTFYSDDEIVTVIVVLEDEPLIKQAQTLDMSGNMPAYLTTAQGAAAEAALLQTHDQIRSGILALCEGQASAEESFDYTAVLNGFSMDIPYGKIEAVKGMKGVKRVSPVEYYSVPENQDSYDTQMANSTGMIGSDVVNSEMAFAGHDGSGAVVAILDTGLETTHDAFSVMPEQYDYTMEAVQKLMNGVALSSGVTSAADTFVNAKVPYAFDYSHGDADVNGGVAHGTHVAGTVAGNNGTDFYGVAPNAQLLIMKIFSDGEGSTSDDIITAGLDDAVKLGADSINMSLGSAAGFSWYRETEMEVYNNCYDAGINLMVAAGNDTSSSYGNQYGNALTQADSMDNAIVGNPSTGYEAMSVASVQNAAVESDYFLFGEEKIAFGQMIYAPSSSLGSFWPQITDWSSTSLTFEYVVVPGVGEESDYADLGDLTGKLALIKRGVTNFEDKVRIARSHGAKGAIIYNNDGGVFNPAYNTFNGGMIGISQTAGEMLIAAAAEGNNFVTFGPSTASEYPWNTPAEEKIPWKAILPADDVGQMSSFSSIGPAPDLAMKPEIAAPGGNIISSVPGNAYQVMSGTSMATPHMAGAAALVRNYVQDVLGVSDSGELRDITEALMMSTADPSRNSTGDEYGPRWQGAGTVDVLGAVTTNGYLTVDNVDPTDDSIVVTRPKAELGWNDDGVYTFAFNIHNISESDIIYTPMAVSLSEGITESDGVKFADGVTRRLSEEDFSITYDAAAEDGTITVAAGETLAVTATLTLSESYMEQLFADFANGNYVEGYIYLQPAEGETLVLPYLGYCGDWTKGLVFEGDPSTDWQLQPSVFATMNITGAGYYLGENAHNEEVPYNYDRLAFSAEIGDAPQYLAMILTTRRNLTDASISIKDADGNVVWGQEGAYLQKSYYYPTYGIINTQILTDGWTGRYYNEETGLYDGDFAPNGQYYTIELAGNVAQCEDARHVTTYPLWLDSGAPEVSNIECYVDETDGKYKLAFDAQDDHYINLVNIIDSTDSYLLTYTVQDFAAIEEQAAKSRVILDLDGLCQFLADNGLNPGRIKLSVQDYAMNTRDVYVDLGPQYLSMSNMTVAVGDSQAMSVRILPARLEGNVALVWTSSDENVATVDEDGVVTGVAYGTATITATADTGLSASAIVTVGDETLPPETPETPDPDAVVDYPSAEALPIVWDTRVEASETDTLGQKFEFDGLWYKVTGKDTVQLIANPNVANDYSATYPNAPAELVIPETVTYLDQAYTVTTIGPRAFYYCNQFTSITLPDTIRVIGDYAFLLGYWGVKLEQMNLPEGLEEIGDYALYGNALVDFQLPASLRLIGTYAFNGTGITEVDFGENIEAVGARAFNQCKSLVKAELTRTTQDTEGLYLYCDALAEVEIEDGVERIPENCFYYASFSSVELPDSVTEIGKAAFYGTDLTDLCLEGTNVTTIGDFAYAGLEHCYDFVFPDSVTYIGSDVLYWCRYVRSISFGENVAYIGNGMMSSFFIHGDVTAVIPEVKSATAGAAVRRSGYVGQMTREGIPFDVYAGAPFALDGISYMPISEDEVMVTGYDQNTVSGAVVIPETVTCEGDETTYTVTAVADRLFSQKYNITEVHLPDTITTVGERAFDQIHALSYINIPKNLTTLSGLQAFGYGGWNNLEWNGQWAPDTLEVPGSLKTWNVSAFSGNKYTKVILEDGLEMVGSYGVSNNNNLTEVEMASTVKYIKDNAFANNPMLTNVDLSDNLIYIGTQAFQNVPLESVELPDTLQYIGPKAFSAFYTDYNTPYPYVKTYVSVEKVTIPGGVIGLGWNAFEAPVLVTTTLGSQRNMVVERCNLDNLPTVRWDGRTDIPAGDYSVVPEGATVWVSEDVVIDGELRVEGQLRVAYGCEMTVDEDAVIVNPENIVYEECPHRNVTVEIVEATCTEDGSATAHCLDCGEDLSTEVLVATGHEGQIVGYVAHTCTEDGYTGDLICAKCGELLRQGEVLHAYCASAAFDDLEADAWYHEYTDYVIEQGLMNGVRENSFAPDAKLNRAMLVTVLYRMAGEPEVGQLSSFTDVPADAYYTVPVAWAQENGITKGVTERLFAPEQEVSRQQAAMFLYRYATGYLGVQAGETADLSAFTDGSAVAEGAKEAMGWAIANGLFEGYPDGSLRPAETLNRAEMAKLLTILDQKF